MPAPIWGRVFLRLNTQFPVADQTARSAKTDFLTCRGKGLKIGPHNHLTGAGAQQNYGDRQLPNTTKKPRSSDTAGQEQESEKHPDQEYFSCQQF